MNEKKTVDKQIIQSMFRPIVKKGIPNYSDIINQYHIDQNQKNLLERI